jgi:hypothetical protein
MHHFNAKVLSEFLPQSKIMRGIANHSLIEIPDLD